MTEVIDVGSLPVLGELETIVGTPDFEQAVLRGFLGKINAGIDIPNYPQYRDMNEMFFELIDKVEKKKEKDSLTKYSLTKPPEAAEDLRIPEVSVIKENSSMIYEEIGRPFRMKICVTGPSTLNSLLGIWDTRTLEKIGEILSKIIDKNIFSNKYGRIEMLSLDEPVAGAWDDSKLDYGTDFRESMLKIWKDNLRAAKVKGVKTSMHLHKTTDNLFWEVDSLDIIEAHVHDPLYHKGIDKETGIDRIKNLLKTHDKVLKASIGQTDPHELVKGKIVQIIHADEPTIGDFIGYTFNKIRLGNVDFVPFLDAADVMRGRLQKTVDRFGEELVPYAGLECGLRDLPSYESAIEYLQRSAEAVHGEA